MRFAAVFTLMLVSACAHHPSRVVASTSPVPCPEFVPSADSLDWKLVQAEGFTFCVPPTWRASGAHAWRGDGAGIDWSVGTNPRSLYLAQRTFPVGMRGPDPEPRHFVEMIGGESAELWDGKVQDAEYTFAEWSERHTNIEGKSSTPHGAELELMIYRTVRFTTPAPAR